MPVQVAIELGAHRVYAIAAGSPLHEQSLSNTIANTAPRAIGDLMIEQIEGENLKPFSGWPGSVDVIVIRPSIEVHNAITIDPGLIDIAIDYGYMMAADVLQHIQNPNKPIQLQMSLADRITLLRRQAWYFENALEDPRPSETSPMIPPDMSQWLVDAADAHMGLINGEPWGRWKIEYMRTLKRQIRDLAQQRHDLSGILPANVERTWQQFESIHGLPTH